MCELMGLNFARPTTASISFREFGGRGQHNPDGWGLAWYPDRSAAVAKEPVSWRSSAHTQFLETYRDLKSAIYVAHVRHRTVGGEPTHADTHPFVRELGGREFVFAHNGTLKDLPMPAPECRFQPVGATDSERAFCHVLERLSIRRRQMEDATDFEWLRKEFRQLNEYGKFNCLLSDGQRVFCYRDTAAPQGLMWNSFRLPGNESEHFRDCDLHIAIESPDAVQSTMVVTQPADSTGWQPIAPGELLVLHMGRVAFA